jgi:hypothetical protein
MAHVYFCIFNHEKAKNELVLPVLFFLALVFDRFCLNDAPFTCSFKQNNKTTKSIMMR